MTEEPKQPTPEPGTRHKDHTFLVGENIYLRTLEPGDERNATSWRNSIFPASPERMEKWIKEDLPKEGKNDRGHLVIVRKSDDVVIGSLTSKRGMVDQVLTAHVDPLYGEQGERWLAEAVMAYADWQLEEVVMPALAFNITTDQPIAIQALLAGGFVESARHREMIQRNGKRYDRLTLARFSSGWVEKLGNPMDVELPRTGNGEVAPVKQSVIPESDPPKNAVIIGERVYLRPLDKKDAKREIELARMEDEPFWNVGRHLSSEAAWEEFISAEHADDYPLCYWFAVCLREDDKFIGSIGLIDTDWVNHTAETGSFMHSAEYRGKGYGSEAKQLLLEYCFTTLGMHTLISVVKFANTRSAAAVRKQGYREAGRICWRYSHQGTFGNMVTFDLLASEWRALPREAAE